MIKINNLKAPIEYSNSSLKGIVAEHLRVKTHNISNIITLKKSLDARRKNALCYVLTLAVELDNEKELIKRGHAPYTKAPSRILDLSLSKIATNKKIAIIGSGPAGMFCALTLAKCGISVTVFERGACVDDRVISISTLETKGILDTQTNIQFGEGGAGTFSDGKLNTGISSDYNGIVIGEFVAHGAPKEIAYMAKPHIGTDYIRQAVKSIRQEIVNLGGQVRFNSLVKDVVIKNNKLSALTIISDESYTQDFDYAIFAMGHSARDTYQMLFSKGINIIQKPFSIGLRIEHKQAMINNAQYGNSHSKSLPPSDYKLSAQLPDGRGVYTFCMCPGGQVVCGASEKGMLAINGMSMFARDADNANSAVLVSVKTTDFASEHPLAGVDFQQRYERIAFDMGGGRYSAPIQCLDDFYNNKQSKYIGEIKPSYLPNVNFGNLSDCLPSFAVQGIKLGIKMFDKKLHGFASGDAMLTGVETRSSSPIKILRDDRHMSNIYGIMPCGEGSGYAGGITSSAVDGIKTALNLIKILS